MTGPPPPPPPPHGGVPKGSGLPPGKYDIFVIPQHSAGSGFLYLPSLQPNVNSFAAGFASALILVALFQSMAPAFRAWWDGFQGLGNMGLTLMVIGVGFGAWALGRIQQTGPRYGPQSYSQDGSGGYGGTGARASSDTSGAPPPPPHGNSTPPPPPPHSDAPPQPPPQQERTKSTWEGSPPRSPPPQPPPETPPTKPQPKRPPNPQDSTDSPPPKPKESSWDRAREESRRKEEQRRAKEAEQKRRDETARRLAELRAKEAKERQQREKEREIREQQAKERKERLEAEQRAKDLAEKLDHERKERERFEKEAKEIREAAAKEAREAREKEAQKQKEARELEEKRARDAQEREERRKRLQQQREEMRKREAAEAARREELKKQKEGEKTKAEAEAESQSRKGSSYAFSGVGERTSMWPNGRPPAPKSTTSSSTTKPPPSSAPPSGSPKPPPASATRSNVSGNTERTETTHSYRPYDKPKTSQRKKSFSSVAESESSYAPSQTTARTSPPPSMRGPYSTNDPDKIVLSAVYLFMNQFAKTPASQLISGVGSVTDGLILRITTEGLFIDDDVRGVPQREWDVKAWTLKLTEVWCPPHCLNQANAAPAAKPNPLLYKMASSRARERGAAKPLTGDDADVYLTEMLRACKECCQNGLCERRFKNTNIPSPSGQSGEWKGLGLHIFRATVRDQEGKRYVFVVDESEAWKLAVGIQRLRRGTQARQLGVQGLQGQDARGTLEMLGWGM